MRKGPGQRLSVDADRGPHPEFQVKQEAQAAGNKKHSVERETPMLVQGGSPNNSANHLQGGLLVSLQPALSLRVWATSLCSDPGPANFLELFLVFLSRRERLSLGHSIVLLSPPPPPIKYEQNLTLNRMVNGRTSECNRSLGQCSFLYWERVGVYESTEHVPKLKRV